MTTSSASPSPTSGSSPRIVVCDDHTLVRQSLVRMVSTLGDVVGEASNGREALDVVARLRPDLVLLDVNMPAPDGLEVAKQVRVEYPETKLAIVTMLDDDETLRRATTVGVDAYLTKSSSSTEFVSAITSVLEGGQWVSPAVASRLMGLSQTAPDDLTEREREVLVELAAGERISGIARKLFVSEKTVKNHLTSIYAKLGAETGAQAVAVAYRSGLVSPHRTE